jgi:hypothetical protein
VTDLTHFSDTALPYFLLAGATAVPYMRPMQTVVETKAYISAAEGAGMTDEEMQAVVNAVAADPRAGAIMPRCGGARKLRVAKPGTGKSAGYRVITYFGGEDMPVFLLTVFGKNEKANLSESEKNALAALTKKLRDGF